MRRLYRFIAASIPSVIQHSTASDIGSSSAAMAARSRIGRREDKVGQAAADAAGLRPDADAEPRVVRPQRGLET